MLHVPSESYEFKGEIISCSDFCLGKKGSVTCAFREKAIVCPKNDTADAVNAKILSSIEGVTKTYLSRDEAIPMGRETSETNMLYPMEYLNTITFLGFPPHELQLKVGSPIMLLRNVNLSGGLCNGTRMIVISLMSRSCMAMSETAIASLKDGQEDCLPSRVPYQDEDSKTIYPILTDYLGLIRSISDITPFRHATGGQKYRRKVDIESLDGNVVEFTMWDDLATQFNKQEIEKLPPLIIIAVSSCRLSATPATHYYINPKTQEATNAYTMFKEKYSLNPPLPVTKIWYNFRATVADETATAEFTFFTAAGQKITGHPRSHLRQKFEATDKTQLPV
nr:DNA helicase [Tanacetum cinerariifolium]